jgi:bacitracin synthase 3
VPNPFEDGGRLYRTGDRARWLPGGDIEFLGRIDHQVKIRGFRIEPGEVKNRLITHPHVKDAVVAVREDQGGDKYLCAYWVPADDHIPDEAETLTSLNEYLGRGLPHYMIPRYMPRLERIPLNRSGKVDWNALPEPEPGQITGAFAAPETPLEEKITRIWSEVLGIDEERISVNANFFESGGYSLKAVLMIARIQKELDARVPMVQVFKTPTIRSLATYIRGVARERYIPVEKAGTRDYYPLSSAQKRLYVLQIMHTETLNYNMPIMVTLEGDLQVSRLKETFLSLIERHESLRTSFGLQDQEPVQRVHVMEDLEFELEYHDLTRAGDAIDAEQEVIMEDFVRSFDLSLPSQLRAGLVKPAKNRFVLMMDMHHVIADGASVVILIKEFMALYGGEKLVPLTLQYKDYAQWQHQEREKGEMRKQEEYWLNRFKDKIPVLNLPTDFPRTAIMDFKGDEVLFNIDAEITDHLKNLAFRSETTLYVLLLAIYNVLLHKYTAQEDIVVGTPTFGRGNPELRLVIGMFVNMIANRNYPRKNKAFSEFLQDVKENFFQAYENQDYQFEELVWTLTRSMEAESGRQVLVDTVFGLKNMDIQTREIPEVVLPGLRMTPMQVAQTETKFDLFLGVVESAEGLKFDFNYRTALFKKETIQRMSRHFKHIVDQVLEDPDVKILDIQLLTAGEKDGLFKKMKGEDGVPVDKSAAAIDIEAEAGFDF